MSETQDYADPIEHLEARIRDIITERDEAVALARELAEALRRCMTAPSPSVIYHIAVAALARYDQSAIGGAQRAETAQSSP